MMSQKKNKHELSDSDNKNESDMEFPKFYVLEFLEENCYQNYRSLLSNKTN